MQSFSCFVINLDKDVDRMNFMDKQLRKLAISYTRLSAIFPKSLTKEELNEIYDNKLSEKLNAIPLNKGEIGCAASHLAIYQEIVAKKIPYSLILEDDVKLKTNIKEVVEKQIILHRELKHFDYLHFDYFAYGLVFLKLWLPGVYSILLAKKGFSKIYFFCLLCLKFLILVPILMYEECAKKLFTHMAMTPIRDMYFAGAYLVTQEGAEKLLSLNKKVLYTADRLPNITKKKAGLRVKIYTPLMATQMKDIFSSNLKI